MTALPARGSESTVEIRHFHLYCGLGGGAKGFNRGHARVGNTEAKFQCIGGIDSDPAAISDFSRAAGVKGTALDLFDRDQYTAFHGKEPPADWTEATPLEIKMAAGGERPHIIFLSAPCKGFSGLLCESKSRTDKYQALNGLTLRGMWLALEAWQDDPAEFIIFENVPRIANRGRPLLDQIVNLLRRYGYAVAETTHDCGEIGGLAQTRRRFLLVARHIEKVPPFLYEPPKRPLRGVGEILEKLPLPGDAAGGPMHRCPSLRWKTWVRLAFVEAGQDWRSLKRLTVQDGVLKDYGIVPDGYGHASTLGVRRWDEPAGVVADPRPDWPEYGQLGITPWAEPIGTVTSQRAPGQGKFSVADPRPAGNPKFNNCFRVVRYGDTCPCVNGGATPSAGGLCVADPRPAGVAANNEDRYQSQGHYGVVRWVDTSKAVTAAGQHDNGYGSVADPRAGHLPDYSSAPSLPGPDDSLVCRIIAEDETWHRPFTTLELAALQSLIDPEDLTPLHGTSDTAWRERIGNAVPPNSAAAIAGVMGETLLLAMAGETFMLSNSPIWVQPLAIALSIDDRQLATEIEGLS